MMPQKAITCFFNASTGRERKRGWGNGHVEEQQLPSSKKSKSNCCEDSSDVVPPDTLVATHKSTHFSLIHWPKTLSVDCQIQFKKIKSDNLDLDYVKLFSKSEADMIFQCLEATLVYNTVSQVKIFGNTYDVPRKVASFGDEGLTYTYSGIVRTAKPWTPEIKRLKEFVENATKHHFNFVVVNRYKDGSEHIGEHRDDENDLDLTVPIASLTFGQARDFVFRHKDSRGKNKSGPPNVKLLLEHGSLLLMNPPTNNFWYHGLPKRSLSSCPAARINFTFRRMKT